MCADEGRDVGLFLLNVELEGAVEGECDTSRADDPDSVLSPKKEKKKKVLKTPSFLKKKKKDKKEKEKA